MWEHKNQVVVLDAINIIKQKMPGLKFKVLFSGSLEVNRGKGLYINTIKEKIKEHNLEDYISFLGIVDRNDQLQLMKQAVALLQPSLYEGWSTLVEEAKALNQFIILSDLPVHREQINNNVAFFNPHNTEELADLLIKQLQSPAIITKYDYAANIRQFGKDVISALI